MRLIRTFAIACGLFALAVTAQARVVVHTRAVVRAPLHTVTHVRTVAVRPAPLFRPLPLVLHPAPIVRIAAPVYVPPVIYGGVVVRTPVVRTVAVWHRW